MTEIEELKGQIKVLEKKLALLEQIEKHKSPVEKAYRDVYGSYPITDDMSGSDIDYVSWDAFQKGYNAAYVEKVSEEPEEQKWDAVRESVRWCEENPNKDPLDWVKPQTPEETSQSLKEAFIKAQQTESWKEIQKKIDTPAEGIYDNIDVNKLLEKWKKDPPEFLKFELGKTLMDLIYDWWEDIFTKNSDLDMENCIGRLVYWIEEWLPKEQSAAGSQNVYVECTVEGFNDAIKKIKRKLR